MSLSYTFFRGFYRFLNPVKLFKLLVLGIFSLGFFASTSFANLEQTLILPQDASQSKILYSEEWNKLINALETLGSRTAEIFSSAGKVGIGTTNPTEKLEVAGQVKAAGFCLGSDCKTSWGDVVTAGGGLKAESDPVFLASFIYQNITGLLNGNIGIGIANPEHKLSVVGDAMFTGNVSGKDPVENMHFVTKGFLDSAISNIDVQANNNNIVCSQETKGAIRYDEVSNAMVFCDGENWEQISSSSIYGWAPEDNWGECNRTCGGGTQNRYISCKNDTNLIVDQSLCSVGSRPPLAQSCNTTACATYYWEGDNSFGSCDVLGGRKTENIKCYKNTGGTPEVVADWYCEIGSTKTESLAQNITATSNQVITIPKGVSGVTISGYGSGGVAGSTVSGIRELNCPSGWYHKGTNHKYCFRWNEARQDEDIMSGTAYTTTTAGSPGQLASISGDITKTFAGAVSGVTSHPTETSQVFSLDQTKSHTISLSVPTGGQIKVSWNDNLCKKTSDDALIDHQYCDLESSKTVQPVLTTQCTTSWYQSGYSSCSVSCGGGTQSQAVSCRNEDGVSVSDFSCTTTKPALSQACNTQACAPVLDCTIRDTWTSTASRTHADGSVTCYQWRAVSSACPGGNHYEERAVGC